MTLTTEQTKKKAENLSVFLFGEITRVCKWRIHECGEQSTINWIKSLERKYNVIA